MEAAINYAAKEGGITAENIKIKQYPKIKNDELLELLSNLDFQSQSKNEINELIKNINKNFSTSLNSKYGKDKFQTIFPFELRIF